MVDEILKDARDRMQKAIEATRREFGALRTGRPSPSLLEHIRVDYYQTPTPVVALASTSVVERMLVVRPFDKNLIRDIERAILKSDLGLVPSSDGTVIRIPIPPLTEERRRELVKVARKNAEEGRVAIRNIRREAKEMLEQLEQDGEISEDESRRAQERLQKLTDEMIAQLDRLLEVKEQEILEV
ncbi:MAG: ribosome recycling factor [Armatimonadota bacterium]|nr:ribosome recycling factor [Armatimonadota bacterium]